METHRATFCLALKPLGAVLLLVLNILSAAVALTAQDECNKAGVADAFKYLVFGVNQSPGFVHRNAKNLSTYDF